MNKQPEEKKPAAAPVKPAAAPAPEPKMRCVGVNAQTGEAVMEPVEE